MARAVRVPRVNANDDEILVQDLLVAIGQEVASGEVLAVLESDKAVVEVESPTDGFVIGLPSSPGELARVGAILVWIGETPTETVPEPQKSEIGATAPVSAGSATAKAMQLAKQSGISLDAIAPTGERITAADVADHLELLPAGDGPSTIPHRIEALDPNAKAMARAVTWHRDVAVPAYMEVLTDPAPWRERADTVRREQDLLFDPILGLMAFELVEAVARFPLINSTIVDAGRALYETVNIGFTVQTESRLVLVVVRAAETMSSSEFLGALARLQRGAFSDRLSPDDVSGATIAFTSLKATGLTRHLPIIPRHCSLIVAHSVGGEDMGSDVLGATYDHRVLAGHTIAEVLSFMSQPSEEAPSAKGD